MRENKSLLTQLSIEISKSVAIQGNKGMPVVQWISFLIAPLLTWIMSNE